MLVIDIPHTGPGKRSQRVAVLGSCRVRTPCLLLANRGAALHVWGTQILTHTVTEAVQNLEFSLGRHQIPAELAPYIFEAAIPTLNDRPRGLLNSVDTFLIEIADLRHTRVGQYYLQQNYFNRQFLVPNAAQLLPWFRELSSGAVPSDATIDAAIDGLRRAGKEVTANIELILRSARSEKLDAEGLADTLRASSVGGSKRVILVSNFAVPDDTGSLMKDRRSLISNVRQAAATLGAEFFDPSVFFEEYDRKVILQDGTNLFEYDVAFNHVVADRLLTLIRGSEGEETLAAPAVKPIATTINAMMLRFHGERLGRMGLEESGLYAHYAALLDQGTVVGITNELAAQLVVDFLPGFDRYVTMNSGLGELPFILASSGLAVIAMENQPMRFRAMEEGRSHLQCADPLAAARCDVQRGHFPDVPPGARTLMVGPNTLMEHKREDEAAMARRFSAFDSLLVNPRLFLRIRESMDDRLDAVRLIESVGFELKADYPYPQLLYFERASS